jgi:hypothetical protein
VKAYEDVVGDGDLETLKIAEGHDVKYGIRTHARPTQQDVAELKEMISLSLKNGRDGKVGITEADYVRFMSMINAGEPLKRVSMLLGAATRKAEREAQARAERAQQIDSENARMLNAEKAQQEAARIQMETQGSLAETQAKTIGNILEEAVKTNQLPWQQALVYAQGGQPPQQPQQQQAPVQQQNQALNETPPPQGEEV